MLNSQHTIISPLFSFPNILWWAYAANSTQVCFETGENFQKMSYRNRYCIGGSNGLIQLSIPLKNGRNQRTPIKDVKISNDDRWQVQHWRTLVSVYKRSPFFEFYEPLLQPLFEKEFTYLADFNIAGIDWLMKQTNIKFEKTETGRFIKQYDDNVTDLRPTIKPGIEKETNTTGITYYQVFADRTGFLPNLSLLDLLFSEGPQTAKWMKDNRDEILKWER